MSRIAGSDGAVVIRDFRRRFVPVISTIAAILFGLFPFVVTSPLLPDIGFLVLLAWRLLRPEIWPPTVALAFGLFDDLISGNPIGQSMALWTSIFLALELVEARTGYRDFWFDWLYALVAIAFHSAAAWYIGVLMGSQTPFLQLLPQLALAVVAYPVAARMVYRLDRWRLT
jgi:rod shape-determining protein MreD